MRTITIPFTIIGLFFSVSGQIPNKLNASAEELAAMANRTLVVQMDPVYPVYKETYASNKNVETIYANYVASHESYLKNIEAAMRQYWTFNKNIEFKSPEECMELFKRKSPDHVVMRKIMFGERNYPVNFIWPVNVNALIFLRTDMPEVTKKGNLEFKYADFQMYMAGEYGPMGKAIFHPSDLAFTLRQAQKNITWCIEGKDPADFTKYAKAQAKANCGALKGKALHAEADMNWKETTNDELIAAYGAPVVFDTHEELGRIYQSNSAESAVVFDLPAGSYIQGLTGDPKWYESGLAFIKVAVDPSTDRILGVSVPFSGNSVVRWYTDKVFKDLADCD